MKLSNDSLAARVHIRESIYKFKSQFGGLASLRANFMITCIAFKQGIPTIVVMRMNACVLYTTIHYRWHTL